ncbi:MAG: divalent-cation tolerance protein CutA [Candidatus Woesearchaeota archaeon]
MYLVYIPCPNMRVAQRLAKLLLAQKQIACANIIPSTSLYVWQGNLTQSREWILLGKTMFTKTCTKKSIEQLVLSSHPYKLPAILFFSCSAHEPFVSWVKKSLVQDLTQEHPSSKHIQQKTKGKNKGKTSE